MYTQKIKRLDKHSRAGELPSSFVTKFLSRNGYYRHWLTKLIHNFEANIIAHQVQNIKPATTLT